MPCDIGILTPKDSLMKTSLIGLVEKDHTFPKTSKPHIGGEGLKMATTDNRNGIDGNVCILLKFVR